MNDLIINTTAYYIVTVILYVIAVLFFVMHFSAKVKEIVYTFFQKSAKSITNRKFYPAFRTNVSKLFGGPLKKIWSVTFRFISSISVYFRKAEDYFTSKILPLVIEPVNIASLLIRKVYTDSQTAVISVMAALIVAFYFILTIF
ncbi:MAG: hypothetical protein HOP31_05755 [Ignavibacteria bacterium]|nr:hypothetical protein [Ignavibacteria bacterium]